MNLYPKKYNYNMQVIYYVTLPNGEIEEHKNNFDEKKFSYEIAHGGTLIIHNNKLDCIYAPGEWSTLTTDEDTEPVSNDNIEQMGLLRNIYKK